MTSARELKLNSELSAALEQLGVRSSVVYDAQPIPAGLSSARLWRVALSEPVPSGVARSYRRVVKVIAPASDWLAQASDDRRSRELRLRSSGVLCDLPWPLTTGALAYTLDTVTSVGALLMRDETSHLLRRPLQTPPGRLAPMVARLLDGLARMHARYWMNPRLRDQDLGLMSARNALLLAAPETIARRVAAGDPLPYLPLAAAGWESFFALSDPLAAAALRRVFADPAPIVSVLDTLPYTLVHGDPWGPNLGWLPGTRVAPKRGHRLLLLDWALAQAAPCVYDPLWLCGTWHDLDPTRMLAVYRARLTHHLAARGLRLAPNVWRALADAGYLRTALTCGEALGRTATEAPSGAARRRAEARVRWWAHRAAAAAKRLTAQAL